MKTSWNPTLYKSATNTGNVALTGDAVLGIDKFSKALIILTVSGKTMAGGAVADVWVQYSPNQGTTYDDIGHFAQITAGAIADGVYVMVLNHGSAGIADRIVDDAATLAANSVRNQPWGDRMRIKIVPATFNGTTDTITLAVTAWFFE